MTSSLFLPYLFAILVSSGAHGIGTAVNLTNDQFSIARQIHYEALEQGLDPKKVILLAECESGLKLNARGDLRTETGEYMAYGIFQWWQQSWDFYTKKYNLDLDRENPIHQIKLTALVLKNKGGGDWKNCSRKLGILARR